MSERKIQTFLCNDSFKNDMLTRFLEFYNKCIGTNSTEAIIYIDSPGGYVSVVNAMLSLMEGSKIKFYTVGIGDVCSCGLLLLAGGDVRYASDRSEMMFHDISGGSYGHSDQIEDNIERVKKLSKKVMAKFATRTKKPLKWWLEQYIKNANRCFWFDAKQALTLGVIDYIGIPVETTETKTIIK